MVTSAVAAISMPSPAKCWALVAVVAFATVRGLSQSGAGTTPPPYAPAYYFGTQGDPPELVVFPPARSPVVIRLPSPDLPRALAFTPDGRAIFTTINTIKSPRTPGHPARLGPPRLIRIDLSPVQVSTVADFVGLDSVSGLVIMPSGDRILFTGRSWNGNVVSNLFEIGSSGGDFKVLLPRFGAVDGVSPDGSKVLAQLVDGLAIIDIATGAAVPLGKGLWKGAWSPDGRWIAALQLDPESEQPRPRLSRTILIDAHDFSQRRDMGGESDVEVCWSPDSRYLLYSETQRFCSGTGVSLLTMDIESGKRATVKESKCIVKGRQKIGWVSLDVVTEGGSVQR